MGGLAHYIEDEGISTTQISLIREHTERIKPPRALWVSFDLGRPLGTPNDAPFQRSVLEHALKLFESPSGPVLEDFPHDAPDMVSEPVPVACPVSFGSGMEALSSAEHLLDQFISEIGQMRTWYDIARNTRNRTTTGVSGMSPDEAAGFIKRFMDNRSRGEMLGDPALPDKLRLACEDIKAYYLEAVQVQPGQPTDSKSLADWFWGETYAAKIINEIRKICLEDSSEMLGILGKLLLVPRNQVHRFMD